MNNDLLPNEGQISALEKVLSGDSDLSDLQSQYVCYVLANLIGSQYDDLLEGLYTELISLKILDDLNE